MKPRKIAIIAGSRGEYGYYRPIIQEIMQRPTLDYGIVATNMHLLEQFGNSIDEIKKDGFKIDATVYNTFDGYNPTTMTKSLAIFMLQLPEILQSMNADAILIAGDRGEQLQAAIVGAHLYLPVAHIQAGELSGNIDGVTRHAIARFAHIHFAANKDAEERLLKSGEQAFRVHMVGAPQLDEITSSFFTPKEELYKKLKLREDKPIFILAQHAVTEEFAQAKSQMIATINALSSFDAQVVVILSNSDAGSLEIRKAIQTERLPNMFIYSNLPRVDYLGLMNVAKVIVGNSSSGLLEAPSFKLPAVNIGLRQKGRIFGENVICCNHEGEEIVSAITKATSPEFRESLESMVNPYGEGNSARRIVDILEKMEINEQLVVKQLTF